MSSMLDLAHANVDPSAGTNSGVVGALWVTAQLIDVEWYWMAGWRCVVGLFIFCTYICYFRGPGSCNSVIAINLSLCYIRTSWYPSSPRHTILQLVSVSNWVLGYSLIVSSRSLRFLSTCCIHVSSRSALFSIFLSSLCINMGTMICMLLKSRLWHDFDQWWGVSSSMTQGLCLVEE